MADPVDPLRPTAGARYVLERVTERDGGASYLGRVITPEASYAYAVELTPGGEPALTVRGEAAPAPLAGVLAMLARLLARGVDKRVADGMPPWPVRLTRWRGPGRGG